MKARESQNFNLERGREEEGVRKKKTERQVNESVLKVMKRGKQ